MYEQIITYVTAIAPAFAAVVTSITMLFRIIGRTKEMAESLKKNTEKELTEAKNLLYAQVQTLKEEVKRVTDSNEMQQIKEQYNKLRTELEEANRMNAELLAKLNMRY